MSYLITGLVGSVYRTSNARRDSEPLIVESTARLTCRDLSRFLGAVKGITTNPNLLAKSDLPPETVLQELATITNGELYYQLTASSL